MSTQGKTVLVTGGAGFIGANLVRRLLAADGIGEVRVLDDRAAGDHGNLDGLDVVDSRASILDDDALAAASGGVDAIVHLAARASVPGSVSDPVDNHTVNATGTVAVLQAARAAGDAQVIVASSAAIYGVDPPLPTAEWSPPDPRSPYAATKLTTEADAMAWAAAYNLPVLPLRLFNVYGPYQPPGHVYAAAIPSFAASVVRGQPITVFGDGSQTRDFVFVEDVADLMTHAIVDRSDLGPSGQRRGRHPHLVAGHHRDVADRVGGEREHRVRSAACR